MKKVITTEQKQIKLWLDDIEEGALQQAKNLANLPFVFKHVAIMPDSHQGYGMPIGGVLATKGVVIPNAVGVDIGCGICAVKTSLEGIDRADLKKILGSNKKGGKGIRAQIPLGFAHYPQKQPDKYMPCSHHFLGDLPIVSKEYEAARKQVGTLGGGNHFIEIQRGDDGFIWLMIHSGSRNLGYKVANHYNAIAVSERKKQKHPVPKNWQLAYFSLKSTHGQNYLNEMQYCVDFARANRDLMMQKVQQCVVDIIGPVNFGKPINIAHNYAAVENHFGEEVVVHRKGATRAFVNQLGIIPGSQGAKSYIVKGKGEPESFMSCSHGAGRKMGRKQAQRELSLKNEIQKLESLGVLHSVRGKRDLDEAPSAYKDISTVMVNQSDLVNIEVTLTPLAVIKG